MPFKVDNKYNSLVIHLRLKKHYSPEEQKILKGYGYKLPLSDNIKFPLFVWKGIYFSCYNCFEIADIHLRAMFKSKVDLLIASEYNRDVNYFSNIAESITRDVHCYFVQVNSSDFGDSRIIKPSKTEERNILQLKGGNNISILVGKIDIESLRNFQLMEYELQKNEKNEAFKPTPPDFDKNWVRKRMNLQED